MSRIVAVTEAGQPISPLHPDFKPEANMMDHDSGEDEYVPPPPDNEEDY
jgi:hypothetical protein